MKDLFTFMGMVLILVDIVVVFCSDGKTKSGFIANIVFSFITMLGALAFGIVYSNYIVGVVISAASFNWNLVYFIELERILEEETKRNQIIVNKTRR